MIWILSLLLTTLQAQARLNKVGSCKKPSEPMTAKIQVIKQWHLAPQTITKGFKEKYPQERNQTNIYLALLNDIKKKKVDLVVAEGCEGEINADFKPTFNGWDYESLKKISLTKTYDRIVSHVPLKLEARFQDKLLTVCGDNEKLIQEGNLRLSNLRGWGGFWTRLNENKNDLEKVKLLAESAADLLKVPKTTPIEQLLELIRKQISDELALFQKSLHDRNDGFVKALQTHPFTSASVIIGGLHASDLKEKLEAAGLPCDIMEPSGYTRENENLIRNFEKAVQTAD